MIDPKELRIGNLVNTRKKGTIMPQGVPFEVMSIQSLECLTVIAGSNPAHQETWPRWEYSELEPIPLTEEWLLRLGFTKNKHCGHDSHFEYSIPGLFSNIIAFYNVDFCVQLDNVSRKVKHVHQLQNLYFALTGQELKINEPRKEQP